MAEEKQCLPGDALTCEALQRELQRFAEKLPDLFQTFAEETAKISCEQLQELLGQRGRTPVTTRAQTATVDETEGAHSTDHEWAHRHVRPAALRESPKPNQHISVKEIWKAVVDIRRPTLKAEHEAPAFQIVPQRSLPNSPPASPKPKGPRVSIASERSLPPPEPPSLPGSVQAVQEAEVEPPGDDGPPALQPNGPSSQGLAQSPVPEEPDKETESRSEWDEPGNPPADGPDGPNTWDPLRQRLQRINTSKVDKPEVSRTSTSWWHIYEMLVYAWPMEYLTLMVILINAFCLGLETNIMAANLLSTTPEEFIRLGWAFCTLDLLHRIGTHGFSRSGAFFTLEMVLKISANPSRFFLGAAWTMNLLDFFLMALQWLDVVVTVHTADKENSDAGSVNFNIMRSIRMVRLVRIVRSYRVLRMLGEVRAIIWSVGTCLKPLLGALSLQCKRIYLLAVFLVDTCNSYRVAADIADEGFEQLGTYYGSLERGMLTLWQIITGGMDWAVAVNPLMDHTGPVPVFVVFCYIAFALLALLNVITGVCVESAVKRVKEDKDNYLVQYVRGVFKRMETSGTGVITWDDFQSSLFKAIDLDISEAHCVFKILDLDDDGTLDADEFLSGCLRLRGAAKALDVLVLMREIRSMQQQLVQQLQTQVVWVRHYEA
ncbi:IAP1 [Symbiodinium sp. CCMP2456]|nr:IAP1 [Symbiodinium sp. CCMP2456]